MECPIKGTLLMTDLEKILAKAKCTHRREHRIQFDFENIEDAQAFQDAHSKLTHLEFVSVAPTQKQGAKANG